MTKFDGVPVDQPPLVELPDHLLQHAVERLEADLPLVLANHLALGIYEHEGRPRPDRVPAPDLEGGVVDHRMLEAVAEHRLPDVGRRPLRVELRRVHAYDDELSVVLFFQFPQLRKYVQAVKSAVGPEVEDDHLAP